MELRREGQRQRPGRSELTDVNGSGSSDAENRLQKRRRVWAKDTDPLPSLPFDVVRESPCAVCELAVGPSNGLAVSGHMVDCGSLQERSE